MYEVLSYYEFETISVQGVMFRLSVNVVRASVASTILLQYAALRPTSMRP